jgi:hypothetical protein
MRRGAPLRQDADSFAGHQDVAEYLQMIVDGEDIAPPLRFNSPVEKPASTGLGTFAAA